jgi:hypothetical protein
MFIPHSARSATIGFILAARRAGYQPDAIPTALDTISASLTFAVEGI